MVRGRWAPPASDSNASRRHANPPPPQTQRSRVHLRFAHLDNVSAPPPPPRNACVSWQKVQGREANRRRHRLTEPTTKALCQPPPPPP